MLRKGNKGKIITIRGSEKVHHCPLEIGIMVGCEVEMLGLTLFGEPCEVKVENENRSLRQEEADGIKMELVYLRV